MVIPMRKAISLIVVIAIIGYILAGVSYFDIFEYLCEFFKKISIATFHYLKEFADQLGVYLTSHYPGK